MKYKKFLKIAAQGVALVFIIGAAFYLAHFAKSIEAVREAVYSYSYVGIFIISLISGFNLAVPVPSVAFMPLFLESGLHFWASIAFIVAGVTVADSTAYFIGKFGRHLAHSTNGSMIARLERIRERYKWGPIAALFVFVSFVPFSNEILLVPLGFLGYRFLQLLPVIIFGNFLFNMLYSTGAVELFGVL